MQTMSHPPLCSLRFLNVDVAAVTKNAAENTPQTWVTGENTHTGCNMGSIISMCLSFKNRTWALDNDISLACVLVHSYSCKQKNLEKKISYFLNTKFTYGRTNKKLARPLNSCC